MRAPHLDGPAPPCSPPGISGSPGGAQEETMSGDKGLPGPPAHWRPRATLGPPGPRRPAAPRGVTSRRALPRRAALRVPPLRPCPPRMRGGQAPSAPGVSMNLL
ncbi:complement C1q tumor necrosis factor-related protein 5-like [Choloepus didactylus]|uniref:complement C1q tumor necrosis factor-related protein 5-like n=1 Tax=Choloepus didactylus TaxID=27675 RepID=UPI00189E11D3|nr:complement C1q tumor necrosis factor-related protein 5-like [Choloepus didactylus]